MSRLIRVNVYTTSSSGFVSANYEVYTYQGSKIVDGASIVITFTSPSSQTFCTGGNAEDAVFTGVNQAAPIRSSASASHSGGNLDPTLTVTSSYDDVVYEFLAHDRGLSPPFGMTPASGQTVRDVHDNGVLTPSDDGCTRYSDGSSSTCTVARDSTVQGQPVYNSHWSVNPPDATGFDWGYSAISVSSWVTRRAPLCNHMILRVSQAFATAFFPRRNRPSTYWVQSTTSAAATYVVE